MKNIFLISVLIFCSYITFAQKNDSIYLTLAGHKNGDTLQLTDFLEQSRLSLSPTGYTIDQFIFSYTDKGIDYEIKGRMNVISTVMHMAVQELNDKECAVLKINFSDIKVISPKNKKSRIGVCSFYLKIK